MLKKTSKLASLFLLLLLSFIYTDKVFGVARQSDPLMQEVVKYKKENDIEPLEPVINNNEISLGYSGLVINADKSYKNMQQEGKFNKEKIVYESKLPDTTISKTYDYYIKKGNGVNNDIAIIFKVDSNTNVDELLRLIASNDLKVTFFVDGAWLENNVETVFSMANLGCEVYNLGYNGSYNKKMISITNNLLSSVTLKNASYCLNENKDDESLKVCKEKKLHTIYPELINPSTTELKENIAKGSIISYDTKLINISKLRVDLKAITSRGYQISNLSKVISE